MMITPRDIYNVLSAVVPLYITMFLAYASVKWWKIFTPEQCTGINRFVAIFAIPLLSFDFISRINPFKMNILFIAADAASKILVLLVLFLWACFSQRRSLGWCITLFSLCTLPNTLVMGIPLLKSMYGDNQEDLMIQVVVLQSIIWYTVLLFLFEYRAARNSIMEKTSESRETLPVQLAKEDEVVDVIIAKTSPDLEQERLQSIDIAAPDSKELHKFVWKCGCCNSGGLREQSVKVCSKEEIKNPDEKGNQNTVEDKNKEVASSNSSWMVCLIMRMVWYKLIKNPNTYASLLGLSWALASCRWDFKKPLIMENSITILSNAGLGMAMFSLGLFMALQPSIIACGWRLTTYGMLMRFAAGPAVMAVASLAVGIRSTTLKVSIVQAALPQGIVPFVFAREYNLHPEVLSTAVIFGMIVSLPVTILYFVFLGL
ncbi:probable auxin efflux carrier component 1d isoform X2 [Typha angustifolia]|uniref:probable auxin efflux carrier component 1d isoform X2 n=1 Tax=Typha angustifolia TaxID=59011 RepID=UPI003C2F150F